MKKILALALSALFVLGLAGSAFAIHAEVPAETQPAVAKGTTQITLGGNIRTRGDFQNNITMADEVADHKAIYDQRVRLSVEAKVADNVTGYILMEDTYTWGANDEAVNAATGIYGKGNARRGEFEVNEAWILYTAGNGGLKVGHMPLALGNKLFFDHTKDGDDAIVAYINPNDMIHIAALNAKFEENTATLADDAQAYVALITVNHEMFNASADVTWVDDNNDDLDLYNIGVRGSGNVGPVTIRGDIEFQTGSTDTGDPDLDQDFGGTAFLLGVGANLGVVSLDLETGMGSGIDLEDDSNDIDLFVTSLNSGISYIAYMYDTRVQGACGTIGAGICNTTYAKLSAAAKASETVSVKGALVWLMATEDVALNGGDEADSDLGIEVDASVTVALAKNLKYWVEAGYFMPGSAYDFAGDTGPEDTYGVRHGLELSF